jgi:mannose-6-phosphate isomerase-like protein (cupin superfamily)
MKRLVVAICLALSGAAAAQSPGAKVVVLEKDQGEKRLRRPRGAATTTISEFNLKLTPENSESKHLVLGTETIPPGAEIGKHRHLGQDEILFLQTGTAHVVLNDKGYDVHAGGMVFFPMNTWVTLKNTGPDDIQLIFVFSAPGFEQYMRCTSVLAGQPAPPMTVEAARDCSHKGHVEYEALERAAKK